MIRRLLVAVDDSPAALAAARLSVEIAAGTGATVYAVAVVPAPLPGRPTGGDADDRSNADPRLAEAATTVLRYVAQLGERCGVTVEPSLVTGEPAPRILALAHAVGADVIVVGLSRQRGPGQPYIGHKTRHILEFADSPVVVVPAGHPRRESIA